MKLILLFFLDDSFEARSSDSMFSIECSNYIYVFNGKYSMIIIFLIKLAIEFSFGNRIGNKYVIGKIFLFLIQK